MINYLRGTLSSFSKESIVLDVSGFGIEVYPTKALLASAVLGEEMKCHTYLQISDAGLAMFGFASETERDFFLELLQVKTVGGKLAITLMRYLDIGHIIEAVKNGNISMLSVPGLGAKSRISGCDLFRFVRYGRADGAWLLTRRMRARHSDGEGAGRRRRTVERGEPADGLSEHIAAQIG